MRRRWIYIDGNPVEIGDDYVGQFKNHHVMPDIQPYVSMIDGRVINSRSVHREHLRQHGCEEVGNDSSLHREPRPLKPPPGLKETLIQAAHKHLRESR